MSLSEIIESIAQKRVTETNWSQLAKEMTPYLLSNSYRILNDQNLSQDAVQESFMQILKSAYQFKVPNDVSLEDKNQVARGWIMKINRNICLNILRGKKRRKIREENYQKVNESMSIEEIASMQEFRELLRRELAGLSPKDQTPIILKYYSGLNNVEIAREMGCQPSSVGVLISRAIEKLKNKLAKSGVVLSIPFLLNYMEVETANMGQELISIGVGNQFEYISLIDKAKPLQTSGSVSLPTTKGGLVMKLILISVLIATVTTIIILSDNNSDLNETKLKVKAKMENKVSSNDNNKSAEINLDNQNFKSKSTADITMEGPANEQLAESPHLYLPYKEDSLLTIILPDYSKIKDDFKKSPIFKIVESREFVYINNDILFDILEENDVVIPKEILGFAATIFNYLDENIISLRCQIFSSSSANIVIELKSKENANYLNEFAIKPLCEANSLGCTSFVYQNKLCFSRFPVKTFYLVR
jgi:RNA polymerase sigma factor (sigma-70 family)